LGTNDRGTIPVHMNAFMPLAALTRPDVDVSITLERSGPSHCCKSFHQPLSLSDQHAWCPCLSLRCAPIL